MLGLVELPGPLPVQFLAGGRIAAAIGALLRRTPQQ
jgi:hypothetical protein